MIVAAATICTGCGTFRSIEQWKCDRLGLCWFGVRPSNAYGPQSYGPQSYGAPGDPYGAMMAPSALPGPQYGPPMVVPQQGY
jgi:hypothetical protein